MKRRPLRILRGILVTIALLVVGYMGLWFWVSGYPLIDPPPKGEGSQEELDTVFKQFGTYFRTRSAGDLPAGFVHLTGMDGDDPAARETWMIYYATASHSTKRGGTMVLMGSDGRIDGYYGHHCSKADGGTVILSAKGLGQWNGGRFYERFDEVRAAFDESFKHQRTRVQE